jgi:GrpB-like predicted nucleotidyltransferase (UPF0157 family)
MKERKLPPPIRVELLPHDPRWIENAAAKGNALIAALGIPAIARRALKKPDGVKS